MPKIAIIEDDQAIREMYLLKLEQAGYDVRLAADGLKGLELVEEFKPDLILLDLMIPEMTGDKMLEKLRQTSWGAKIKVIILSNVSKDEAPEILHSLDISRYIVKAHHTPKQVVTIVKEILGTT